MLSSSSKAAHELATTVGGPPRPGGVGAAAGGLGGVGAALWAMVVQDPPLATSALSSALAATLAPRTLKVGHELGPSSAPRRPSSGLDPSAPTGPRYVER
jgi:hypothetical protein